MDERAPTPTTALASPNRASEAPTPATSPTTSPSTSPAAAEQQSAQLRRIRRFATLLDSQFRVPGTNFRFGLDGLIGLIPGIGGGVGYALSVGLIVQAIHAGARPVTVARMLLIAGIDAVVGSVPVLGTVADFIIKANKRNARILEEQALDPARTTERSRRIVAATLVAAVVLVAVVVGLALWAVTALATAIF